MAEQAWARSQQHLGSTLAASCSILFSDSSGGSDADVSVAFHLHRHPRHHDGSVYTCHGQERGGRQRGAAVAGQRGGGGQGTGQLWAVAREGRWVQEMEWGVSNTTSDGKGDRGLLHSTVGRQGGSGALLRRGLHGVGACWGGPVARGWSCTLHDKKHALALPVQTARIKLLRPAHACAIPGSPLALLLSTLSKPYTLIAARWATCTARSLFWQCAACQPPRGRASSPACPPRRTCACTVCR